MLKQTIKYIDFNDQPQEKDYYFHLSKAEIAELELSVPIGYSTYLDQVLRTNNRGEIVRIFKELILKSVGERSDDGQEFVKTDAYTKKFVSTPAFSELFMTLCSDATASVTFFRGVLPGNLTDKDLKEAAASRGINLDGGVSKAVDTVIQKTTGAPLEGTVVENVEWTLAELVEMPKDEFDRIAGTDPMKMTRTQLTAAMMRATKA